MLFRTNLKGNENCPCTFTCLRSRNNFALLNDVLKASNKIENIKESTEFPSDVLGMATSKACHCGWSKVLQKWKYRSGFSVAALFLLCQRLLQHVLE